MKQKLAILAVVVAVAALGCWKALAFYNPNVLKVDVAMTGDVAVDGKKPVVFSGSLDPSAPNPKVRVSWIIGKFQMQDASGTAVVWDDFMPGSADTVYKDYTVGTTFNFTNYAFGVANSGLDDQAVTIEALHNTPKHDTVKFTVVKVDKIEYQRFDLSTWVTDLKVAAGAKASDVHKAHVRITIVPAKAGVQVLPAINGGGGDSTPSKLTPSTALTTDSSGVVTTDYISSDKVEDATVKVTSLADCTVAVDLGSTLHNEWDCSGEYDYRFPIYFTPNTKDPLYFYPTLDEVGGVGRIGGHNMKFYTESVTILHCKLDLSSDSYTEDPVVSDYPTYAKLPTGHPITDFVEHTTTTEETGGGVYKNEQTVKGNYYDYDTTTDTFTTYLVESYTFGIYDMDVCYVAPTP